MSVWGYVYECKGNSQICFVILLGAILSLRIYKKSVFCKLFFLSFLSVCSSLSPPILPTLHPGPSSEYPFSSPLAHFLCLDLSPIKAKFLASCNISHFLFRSPPTSSKHKIKNMTRYWGIWILIKCINLQIRILQIKNTTIQKDEFMNIKMCFFSHPSLFFHHFFTTFYIYIWLKVKWIWHCLVLVFPFMVHMLNIWGNKCRE